MIWEIITEPNKVKFFLPGTIVSVLNFSKHQIHIKYYSPSQHIQRSFDMLFVFSEIITYSGCSVIQIPRNAEKNSNCSVLKKKFLCYCRDLILWENFLFKQGDFQILRRIYNSSSLFFYNITIRLYLLQLSECYQIIC